MPGCPLLFEIATSRRALSCAGKSDTDRASTAVWSQLIDMSGTPRQQARRLLSLLFPNDVAKSIYREYGDIVAAARAQLSPDLVNRQAAAMDAWHRNGVGGKLPEIIAPVLIATGSEDVVIPPSNALKLVNALPGAWLAQFTGGGHAFKRSIHGRWPISSIAFLHLDESTFRVQLSASTLSSVCGLALHNGPHQFFSTA